jgi:Flp pilus assembly pilin Flp
MTAYLLTYGQLLKTRLATATDQLQSRLDGLLKAEGISEEQPKKEGLPTWAIILIVVGVIGCLLLLCPIVIIAILTLMGPSIGNVFSEIILDI